MEAAGGRAVRFLLGVPKTPKLYRNTALDEYIQRGGFYLIEYGEDAERYLAEVQDQQPRGRLAV
eukprot:10210582-Heterocapsa_arctica.AAC.1